MAPKDTANNPGGRRIYEEIVAEISEIEDEDEDWSSDESFEGEESEEEEEMEDSNAELRAENERLGLQLIEDKKLLEALDKYEWVKGMITSAQFDLKLDVLSCLQGTSMEIYDSLKVQENNDQTEDPQRTKIQAEKRFPYAERSTRYADEYI